MIFVGDIAIPDKEGIRFENIPEALKTQTWVANLEGALVTEKVNKGVYNYEDGFTEYLRQVPLQIACLANNHITDTGTIAGTKKILDSKGIEYLGAGDNLSVATEPLVTPAIVFLNFGWTVIQCVAATKNHQGVNELTRKRVLAQFRAVKKKYPTKKIIPIFHWNYELELYPMPRQRELAKELIDEGAEIIIGHHSHLVQGIETYKGKYIVHGLGNWAFKQKVYYKGKLSFPPTSLLQVAFEYDLNTQKGKCHYFEYDITANQVSFLRTEEVMEQTNKGLTPFQSFDQKEYEFFFRKNRLKKKLLPVYYAGDSSLMVRMKNTFLKIRDIGIALLIK